VLGFQTFHLSLSRTSSGWSGCWDSKHFIFPYSNKLWSVWVLGFQTFHLSLFVTSSGWSACWESKHFIFPYFEQAQVGQGVGIPNIGLEPFGAKSVGWSRCLDAKHLGLPLLLIRAHHASTSVSVFYRFEDEIAVRKKR
jgi:hypothetical protein